MTLVSLVKKLLSPPNFPLFYRKLTAKALFARPF